MKRVLINPGVLFFSENFVRFSRRTAAYVRVFLYIISCTFDLGISFMPAIFLAEYAFSVIVIKLPLHPLPANFIVKDVAIASQTHAARNFGQSGYNNSFLKRQTLLLKNSTPLINVVSGHDSSFISRFTVFR